MPADEMFDIIHYLFEDDMTPVFVEEPAKTKSKIRSIIYETLYGRPFRSTSGHTDGQMSESDYDMQLKPYIAPTNPEDLSKVLGSPMGE